MTILRPGLSGVRTQDSLLSYYINQLELFDPKLYEPLVSITWSRDIDLRPGVSVSLESTSFTRSSFAAVGSQQSGGPTGGGKSFLSSTATAIPGVDINGEKIITPIRLCGREVAYSQIDLDRSQRTQQPLDQQKMNGLNLVYQMEVDEQVYTGDTFTGDTGLCNNASVSTSNVANGAGGSPLWSQKTPDEILADVNTLISAAWLASGYAVCPDRLLLPPTQYAYIASQKVSNAGNVSILTYLEENSISLRVNGRKLEILPVKWLAGLGVGSTNRMVAYTKNPDRVRFVLAPIQRMQAYYMGLNYASPYVWGLGSCEFIYPETVAYADGI